ncbi:MAG: hypothetical protein AB7O52_17030 [Planctomycetota bacterium]
MVRVFAWSVLVSFALGWVLMVGAGPTQGQIIIEGGQDGTALVLVEEDGVYPLVFQLKDDNWTEAKGKLLERARGVDRVEVIHALTQMRRHENEKVQLRIDAVLGALGEAGLYPLTLADFKAQVKQLGVALSKLEKGKPAAEVNTLVLMALVRAQREIQEAQAMVDTGKVPAYAGGETTGVGEIIEGGSEQ